MNFSNRFKRTDLGIVSVNLVIGGGIVYLRAPLDATQKFKKVGKIKDNPAQIARRIRKHCLDAYLSEPKGTYSRTFGCPTYQPVPHSILFEIRKYL
ncbi:MAG: hypothetical protein ABH817_00905 [archaeon]